MNLQISLPFEEACPFNCKFCIARHHPKFKGITIPALHLVKELIPLLMKNHYDRVVFTGENEPLQSMDYMAQVIAKMPVGQGIELVLRGYKFDQFVEKYPLVLQRITLVNFSVSEAPGITYSEAYDEALRMAKICKDMGVYTRFTFMLSKKLSPHMVRHAVRSKWVDQITLKELQGDNNYVKRNKSKYVAELLFEEATKQGAKGTFKSGQRFIVFRYDGHPIWVDLDCQNSDKYHILRSDGKLYKSWEDQPNE